MAEIELTALTKIFSYPFQGWWVLDGDRKSKAETQDLRADGFYLHLLYSLAFSEISFLSYKIMVLNI